MIPSPSLRLVLIDEFFQIAHVDQKRAVWSIVHANAWEIARKNELAYPFRTDTKIGSCLFAAQQTAG